MTKADSGRGGKTIWKLITPLFCLFFTLSMFSPIKITRAAELSSTISPVTFELTANPGDVLKNTVKVSNISSDTTDYTMQLEPFTGNELGQATVLEGNEQDPKYDLKGWTKMNPSTFALKSKESRNVEVTISIPKNAEPGGRYGTVLASSGGQVNEQMGTGAIIKQKVGTLVLLTITGDIKYKAFVETFKPSQSIYEKGPITLKTTIKNESNVHIKPKGFITVTNIFGKEVAKLTFEEKNVLPPSQEYPNQNERLVEAKWDSKPKIGYYTANLALIYGDKNEPLSSSTTFFVFPWKIGAPIILAVLILLWFMIARRRNFKAALKIIFNRH